MFFSLRRGDLLVLSAFLPRQDIFVGDPDPSDKVSIQSIREIAFPAFPTIHQFTWRLQNAHRSYKDNPSLDDALPLFHVGGVRGRRQQKQRRERRQRWKRRGLGIDLYHRRHGIGTE